MHGILTVQHSGLFESPCSSSTASQSAFERIWLGWKLLRCRSLPAYSSLLRAVKKPHKISIRKTEGFDRQNCKGGGGKGLGIFMVRGLTVLSIETSLLSRLPWITSSILKERFFYNLHVASTAWSLHTLGALVWVISEASAVLEEPGKRNMLTNHTLKSRDSGTL